jgi:uncharacterized DUF497 family protein
VKITFDLKKDAANVKKHGVSLRLSCEIDWGNLTIRDDALRVISLRKATRLEIKRYENQA